MSREISRLEKQYPRTCRGTESMSSKTIVAINLFLACVFLTANAHACSAAAWSSGASGNVEVNDPANGVLKVGGECGLMVSGTGYVQDNSPIAEEQFIARFYFYPQFSGSGSIEIFAAYADEATSKLFSVRFDGSNITVNATAASGGSSSPVAITQNRWALIEFSWKSDGSGGLWVNADATKDPASATFVPGTGFVEAVRLGAPDGFGGLSGKAFFDDYESHRSLPIGPLMDIGNINVESDARILIESFYLDILGRGPEAGAVDSWYNGYFQYAMSFDIDVRFVPREMARIFFLSTEYAMRNRTNEQVIRDCYQTFLNRSPSAAELEGWSGGGWDRAQAMTLFAESAEFGNRIQALFPGLSGDPTRNLVTTMYIGLLDRLVDSGGLNYFTGLFNTGYANGGIEGVRDEARIFGRLVLESNEYLSKSPTNETHVIRFYRAYLGRFPAQNEIDYWKGELDAGRQTTDTLIDIFAAAQEFTDRLNAFF